MPAGNFSVLNTVSSLMDKCPLTKPSEEEMMPSTLSSVKLVLVNTSPEPFSSIWNPPLSMKSEPVPTDNYSTPNNWSPERKMPPTTSPEVTTPLVKKSSISASTESESSLITVPVSKVSWSSTPSEEELVPVSDPSFWKDFPSITVRNQSSDSPSIPLLKSLPPSSNHTTPFFLPTPSWNTPMSPLCSITKPSMISAEDNSILKDPPTPT